MLKKTNNNNLGFSLVELIIVIAIMAILVGIVGTQVIPYMEKSRQARDYQLFSAWNTAGMSAYTSNADRFDPAANYEIVITDGGVRCSNPSLKEANLLISTFCNLTNLEVTDTTNKQIVSRMNSKAGVEVKAVKISIPAMENGTAKIITEIFTDIGMSVRSTAFSSIENK